MINIYIYIYIYDATLKQAAFARNTDLTYVEQCVIENQRKIKNLEVNDF